MKKTCLTLGSLYIPIIDVIGSPSWDLFSSFHWKISKPKPTMWFESEKKKLILRVSESFRIRRIFYQD